MNTLVVIFKKMPTYTKKTITKTTGKKYPKKETKAPLTKAPRDFIITKRTISVNVNEVTGFATAGNYYFDISQIPDIAELMAVFQKFKLLRVECVFNPRGTVNTQVGGAGLTASEILYAFNPNNGITGTPTYSTMDQLQGRKIGPVTKTHKIIIYPVLKNQIGQYGATTYYTDMRIGNVWLNSTNLGVRNYGLDFFIPNMGLPNGTVLGQWELTYVLLCKGSH